MIDFLIYTIFTLYTAGVAVFLKNDMSQIIVLIVLAVLFIYRRCRIDSKLVILMTIWCSINLLSFFLNRHANYEILSFLSVTARILFAYLMIKIVGSKFFNGLFKYWFVLCLLSFPCFVIESLYPDYVNSLAPRLNFMSNTEQMVKGGFYVFFYMHSAFAQFYGGFVRNCGFMWEPGAFAGVLIFMIVYHLYEKDFKLDWKTVFLLVCVLTTYSTAGYLALFFVLGFYFYYNPELSYKYRAILPVVLVILFIIGLYVYFSVDFLAEKVAQYSNSGTNSWSWSFQGQHVNRVSRYGIWLISLEDALINPWGSGIITSDFLMDEYNNPNGPNMLADMLRQWGWLGLIMTLYSLYYFNVNGKKTGLIMLLPMSIVLFSNPEHFRYLLFAIIYSAVCIDKHDSPENEDRQTNFVNY